MSNTDQRCTANTLSGTRCKKIGKDEYNGLCKTHHTSYIPPEERAIRRAEQQEREAAQRRNTIIEHNQKRIENIATYTIDTYYHYARNIAKLWITYKIPGNLLGQVYVHIRKTPIRHESWDLLARAVVEFYYFAYNHPNGGTWRDIPDIEKTEALNKLQNVIARFPDVDLMTVYSPDDMVRIEAERRHREEEEARLEAERRARIARLQEERERRFREEQVVFRRDPEGGIDLAAFGNDSQSVHRSSIQIGTDKVLTILMNRPVPKDQETLVEITAAFNDETIIRFATPDGKNRLIMEVTNDYFNTMGFNRQYGEVIDRVWAFIRGHKDVRDLIWRLAEEVMDGVKQCVNGKMARLAQTLYHYDPEITAALQNEPPPREAFQAKFATLVKLARGEREAAANAVFDEYQIPKDERAPWLEYLLEHTESEPNL